MSDTPHTILSSLKRFFSGTLLSRVTGLMREMVMAFSFGVSPAVASFWVAFRLANLFRRLFGEGGLNVAFIPHFESLKKQDRGHAISFLYNLSQGVTYLLLALVICIEFILGSLLVLGDLQTDTKEILKLSMIMLPSLIFLSLYALNSAVLNTERRFFLPSAAPSIVNLFWIVAAMILHNKIPAQAMQFLAMVIVFAFAAQWLVTHIPLTALFAQKSPAPFQKKELTLFLKPFFLTIIAVTAQQINSAVDALFAKAADPEGPAILWYALRLQQLPFALIGVGLMNALLPPLSRTQSDEEYSRLLNFSLKKVSLFMIPLTFAIIVGSFSAVNLIYGRGAFSERATYQTSISLMAYGTSLFPMAWTLLLASAFFAKKEYKIPTLCSLISIVANIALNALFVFGFEMKAISIAIATALASALNVILLAHFLSKKTSYKEGLFNEITRTTCASLIAAIITITLSHYLLNDNTYNFFTHSTLVSFPRNVLKQLIDFSVISGIFLSTLYAFASIFKVKEMFQIRGMR